MSSRRLSASPEPQVTALGHRYSYKLMASAAALLAGLAMELLLPRALGSVEYGKYNYATQFFVQALSIISGASTGFAARIARRPKARGLLRTYLRWLLIMLALAGGAGAFAFLLGFNDFLWPSLSFTYVELGCLAAYFTMLSREITGMGDAYGLTVRFETVRIVQRIAALLVLILLFVAHLLDTITAFLFVSASNLVLAASLMREAVLKKSAIAAFFTMRDRVTKPAARFLVKVAVPTTTLTALSGLSVILDRWALEQAGGNSQQGYFSLAYQMIQVITIFAAAMSPLLTREMSISHDRSDFSRLRSLYSRFLPTLALAVAVPCCFLAREAGLIGFIAGGREFVASQGAITAMALVPIYAAYGFVSIATYFATQQLRLYSNIGVVVYSLSPILTWLFVAPLSWHGLAMGATGLAIKTLLVAVIYHNAMIYFTCRQMGLSYGKILFQQLFMLASLGLATSLAHLLGAELIPFTGKLIPALLELTLDFAFYAVLTVPALWAMLALLGIERQKLSGYYRQLLSKG